jgi:hypothetical protein
MTPEMIDLLAAAMHENYRHEARVNHWPMQPEADLPYAQLSPALQETNRAAARRIPEVLDAISVRIVSPREAQMRSLSSAELYDLIQQNMKTLAPAEHEGWMNDRAANGWQYGEKRDNAQKLHPSMVPFEKLSAEDKEKDRNQVRSYPDLIEKAGLAAVKG